MGQLSGKHKSDILRANIFTRVNAIRERIIQETRDRLANRPDPIRKA